MCVKIHKHPFGKYILNTTIYINDRFVHLFRNAKLNTVKWVHFNEPRTGSMMRNDEWISNYIFLQLFSLQLMSIFEMLCNIYANTYHNIIIIMYKCTVLTLFEFSMDFMTKTGLISNFQTQKNAFERWQMKKHNAKRWHYPNSNWICNIFMLGESILYFPYSKF